MQYSVSIQLIWTTMPFPERVAAAARAGFDLVDLWDRRTSDLDAVAAACRRHGIGINGFFGTRDHGLWDPGERAAALDEIGANLQAAARVGARQLHVFSNAIVDGSVRRAPHDSRTARESCIETLRQAAGMAEGTGVTLLLEPLNPVSLPGCLWSHTGHVVDAAREVDRPEVRVVFDVFHQQLSAGRLTDSFHQALPWLGRVDVSGVPDRCEPTLGEINFGHLCQVIRDSGWDGTISFEVVPSSTDAAAVDAIKQLFPVGEHRGHSTCQM